MKFGPDHYVPVLKFKRAEKMALGQLGTKVLSRLTPLLEIVETKGGAVEKHINKAFKDFDKHLKNVGWYFLDARELAPDGPTAPAAVFEAASRFSVPFVPVTGITRPKADVAAAVAAASEEIGIRLTRQEFEAGNLSTRLSTFLRIHNLVPSAVHLFIDLGAVDEMIEDGVSDFATDFVKAVPTPTKWMTLTVIGSSFPKSMRVVKAQSFDFFPRAEWLAWRDHLFASRSSLPRLPTFGDCGIQHPAGVEGFNFKTMRPSASIRYALSDTWLLVKGVSAKKIKLALQFPKMALQVASGSLAGHFAGRTHCSGCKGIQLASMGGPSLGSAEAWRRLGTIHHLTVTTEQLAQLPWP